MQVFNTCYRSTAKKALSSHQQSYDDEGSFAQPPSFISHYLYNNRIVGAGCTKQLSIMKKLLLSLVLCVMAITASAQLKSVDAKLDLRGDFGFGAGVTLGVGDKIEIAPSASLYFPASHYTMYTADVNVHYLLPFEIHEQLELYPLAGVGYYHYSYDYAGYDWSHNELLINVGAGARWHINDAWAAFAEEKFQIVDGYNSNFMTVGISFKF